MKRTPKQNAIIHKLKNSNGISDENYRALIARLSEGRTETSAELTRDEADALISELGGTPPPRTRRRGKGSRQRSNVEKLMSPPQWALLQHLAEERWGAASAPMGLHNFLSGQIGKGKPHTSREASRMIQALRGMNAREDK